MIIRYEINKEKIILEGEDLNEKKLNGKGKEYNDDGELKFEGKYLNGEKMEREKNNLMNFNIYI